MKLSGSLITFAIILILPLILLGITIWYICYHHSTTTEKKCNLKKCTDEATKDLSDGKEVILDE